VAAVALASADTSTTAMLLVVGVMTVVLQYAAAVVVGAQLPWADR